MDNPSLAQSDPEGARQITSLGDHGRCCRQDVDRDREATHGTQGGNGRVVTPIAEGIHDDEQVDVGVGTVVAASYRTKQDNAARVEGGNYAADDLRHPFREGAPLVTGLAVDHLHRSGHG